MTAGALVDSTGTVALTIPWGWSVADDVGAVVCEAPAAQADITGRVCAASLRIEPADRGALVPRLVASGRRPGLVSMTQDVVADTFRGDPTAVLVDARRWLLRTATPGRYVEGVRIDLAHHDMSTAMTTTTILVDGGQGLVRVTAALPVAHHRALGGAVEQAVDSIVVDGGVAPGAPDLTGQVDLTKQVAVSERPDLGQLDPGSWDLRGYRPAQAAMDATSFDVFTRGSHKISPRWRPPAVAAGLVEAHGVATPLGHYVRRAVSRPDRRVVLRVEEIDGPRRAELYADVLERHAVLRATTPAHIALLPGNLPPGTGGVDGPGATFGLEVQEIAAVPARLAAWLGLGFAGHGQSFLLGRGLVVTGMVIQSVAPGVPAEAWRFELDPSAEGPVQLWARLVTLLA